MISLGHSEQKEVCCKLIVSFFSDITFLTASCTFNYEETVIMILFKYGKNWASERIKRYKILYYWFISLVLYYWFISRNINCLHCFIKKCWIQSTVIKDGRQEITISNLRFFLSCLKVQASSYWMLHRIWYNTGYNLEL